MVRPAFRKYCALRYMAIAEPSLCSEDTNRPADHTAASTYSRFISLQRVYSEAERMVARRRHHRGEE